MVKFVILRDFVYGNSQSFRVLILTLPATFSIF
jgi:hypothetical protein